MSFDWKGILSTVAPMLATAYGTPLAGMATKTILTALGVVPDPKATEEENQQVIAEKLQNATPAELLALKNADYQFKKDMKSLDVDFEKIASADRASARDFSTKSGTSNELFWFSIIILGIGLSAEIWVLFRGYSNQIPEIIVGRVLGLLDALVMLVASFWYGTTRSSQTKDTTIQNLSK